VVTGAAPVMSQAAVEAEGRPALAGESRAPLASWDLTRILLAVVGIGGLIVASLWIVSPFLPAVIWATMIVVATWPMLRGLQARLWGRRSLAVAVMTVGILAVIAVPLTVAVVTVADRAVDAVAWGRAFVDQGLPALPEWLVGLPLVGPRLADGWQRLATAHAEDVAARLAPYTRVIAAWLIGHASSIGGLLLQCLLTVVVSAILYAKGEAAAGGVLAFARRLAGTEGIRVAVLSAGAVRAVALGIVVTALVQSVIGGIGLALTGVPNVVPLTSVMVLLGVAQIGPLPVMLGAIVWLYADGQTFWGTVLVVWGVVTVGLDNILRPVLIRRGADLPLLLIIMGVIGGLLAFGVIGLFVGPVVLAVTYTLLVAWVATGGSPPAPGA
jgi:predicted PurR-regulated permease PerM